MPAIRHRYRPVKDPEPVEWELRRRARRPQIEHWVPIVPIAIARHVVEEASRWLGEPLPGRYAAALAFRAQRCFAHSELFREKARRPGDAGRDLLYVFMRHWLAARFHAERPELFRRLPAGYACGALLPLPPPVADNPWLAGLKATGPHLPTVAFSLPDYGELSLDARLLAFG